MRSYLSCRVLCPGKRAQYLREDLSQLTTKNLSRSGTRYSVDEANFSWLLIVSEAVGDEGAEGFIQSRRWRIAITKNYEGAGNLTGCGIGTSHHSAITYRRVLQ
jgi:hypothetical protein